VTGSGSLEPSGARHGQTGSPTSVEDELNGLNFEPGPDISRTASRLGEIEAPGARN